MDTSEKSLKTIQAEVEAAVKLLTFPGQTVKTKSGVLVTRNKSGGCSVQMPLNLK